MSVILNAAVLSLALNMSVNDAEESLARRVFVLEADAHCALFTEAERQSLAAAARQVRGALNRAGYDPRELERRVREAAASRACDDPMIQDVATEARQAHQAWAQTRAMDFPGLARAWTVRRVVEPDSEPNWTLWQRMPNRERFGLAVTENGVMGLLAIPADSMPDDFEQAWIELRDPMRLDAPIDPTLGGLISFANDDPLAAKAAPSNLSARFWAAGRQAAYGETAPVPDADYVLIEFPAAVLEAIAELGAEEAARIRIVSKSGASERYVEAGDLPAALAFLKADPMTAEG